jgi:hypothetical protein
VLLSHNVANKGARVVDPHPAISIFNFHYATPPDTIAWNAHLERLIGDNETGFRGTADAAYRTEGWDFILAGGGLYNNLDYSFTVGHEDGTFAFPPTQPGGGGAALRGQLGVLRRFIDGFDLVKLRPDPGRVKGGLPPGGSAQVLADPGRAYAVYLRRQTTADGPKPVQNPFAASGVLQFALEPGTWAVSWLNPVTGESVRGAAVMHPGGVARLTIPAFADDIAVRIRRDVPASR